MNCEQTREHLVEYLYGELPPELASEVEAELDHCPACAAQLAEMRRVHELVAALPRLDVPGPVHHDILRQARLSATRERSAARGSFASFFLSPAFATAVVVCLVLGVGILLEQRGARPPSEAPPETAAVRTSSSAIAQQTPAEPVEETVAQAGPTPQASRPQAAVPQDNAAAPTSPVGPSDLGPVAQVEPVRPVEPAPAAAFGARELPSPGPTGQSIVTATPIAHAAAAQHESPPAPDEAEAPAPEVVAQLDQPTSHHARADRNAEIDLERQQGELERQQSEQRRLEAESQGSQRQIRTGDRQGQGGALPAAPEPPRATAAPGFENRTEGTAGVAQQGQATVGGEALADRDHPAAGAPATGTPGSSRAADGSSTSGEATAAPPEQPAAADRSRQAHHAHEDADAEMAAIPEAERPVTEAGEATQAAPVVPEIAAESSGAGRIGTELNEEPSDELSYLYGENEQASPPAEEAGNADQGVAAAQPSSAVAEPSAERAYQGTGRAAGTAPTGQGGSTAGEGRSAAPEVALATPSQPATPPAPAATTTAPSATADVDQLYRQGLERYNDGSYRDAITYFDAFLQNAPRTSDLFGLSNYYQGQARMNVGDYRAAEGNFSQITDPSFPHYLDARLLLAQSCEYAGDLDRAEDLYNQLRSVSDERIADAAAEGFDRIRQRRADDAQHADPMYEMEPAAVPPATDSAQ